MNIILPYLIPMLLGRTIDLHTYSIGGSIYDYANYVETPVNTINSTYYVIQDDSFPYSAFGLPIDIVLRIKSDYLTASSGAMGLGGLLKDTSWKFNSVLVAAATVYRTVDRKLLDNATLISDWKEKIPISQTHYANELNYGEWCVVLFKFKCDVPGDVQLVRKALTNTLGVSGQLDQNIIDLWNQAVTAIQQNEDIRGTVKVTPTMYSTIQLDSYVNSIESFVNLLKKIPELVTVPGTPLNMELKPLFDVDDDYSRIDQTYDLESELQKMDDMLDDLKITKENIVKWTTETTELFSDEDEEKIYNLLEKINSCFRSFRKINDDISLFNDMDKNALELAFHQYLIGLKQGIGTYNLEYLKLREEIDAGCKNEFLHKIKGLLKVYENEQVTKGEVSGIDDCKKYCQEDERCRAIGFAEQVSRLDISTGLYYKEQNQCWIYYRSTTTAIVDTPSEVDGDWGVYDRKCFLK